MTTATTNTTTISTQSGSLASANVRLMCAMVFTMGAGLLFLVGFSHTSAVHNAAHDTRHGLAFPCH